MKHHTALVYAQVPAFMARLSDEAGMAALALRFAILTAARTGEVIGATSDEVDLDAKIWTVPGDRMKSGREHRVPLTDAAMKILRASAGAGYLFHGGKVGAPLSNMAMLSLLRRMNSTATTHGFRSSFRDWVGDETNFPRELAELALAHKVGDTTEQAYRATASRSGANSWMPGRSFALARGQGFCRTVAFGGLDGKSPPPLEWKSRDDIYDCENLHIDNIFSTVRMHEDLPQDRRKLIGRRISDRNCNGHERHRADQRERHRADQRCSS